MKVKDLLERKGINVIYQYQNYYKCEYNNKTIQLELNSGLGNCYKLIIDDEVKATKALITTCICKILNAK